MVNIATATTPPLMVAALVTEGFSQVKDYGSEWHGKSPGGVLVIVPMRRAGEEAVGPLDRLAELEGALKSLAASVLACVPAGEQAHVLAAAAQHLVK